VRLARKGAPGLLRAPAEGGVAGSATEALSCAAHDALSCAAHQALSCAAHIVPGARTVPQALAVAATHAIPDQGRVLR
jgi:hypothetical protein